MSDENTIFWSSDYELKLSDFKKEHDEKDRKAFSYIQYNIDPKLEYNEDRTKYFIKEISLQTKFLRDRSFFNRIKAKNDGISQETIDYVILHEQGHFDLAEDLLPKIQRIIESQCKGKTFPTRGSNFEEIDYNANGEADAFIVPVYNRVILEDWKKEQLDVYDYETNHGKIKSEQDKYNARFKQFRKIKSKK